VELVTSSANPRLRRARRLRGRRARESLGLFVAEGEDLVAAALAAGIRPLELLATPDAELPPALADAAVRVRDDVLAATSTLEHPARVVGVYRRADLPAAPAAVGLALELHDVRDPGNAGTVLRAAAALGADVVVLGRGCADPTGPRAVRASMGALFRIPLAPAPPAGLRRVALDAHAETALADVDLAAPTCLVLGGERAGLPADAAADVACRIPQSDAVDSLNVAMAATVALYEVARQRGLAGRVSASGG
jgi:RNA methyltransferase, TrmH family